MSFRRFMMFMAVANAGRAGRGLVIPNRPSNVSPARWRAMNLHFSKQGYDLLTCQRAAPKSSARTRGESPCC